MKNLEAIIIDDHVGTLAFTTIVGFDHQCYNPIRVTVLCAKDGSTLHGVCMVLSQVITLALEYGADWVRFRESLEERTYEPAGEGRFGKHYASMGHAITHAVDLAIGMRINQLTSISPPDVAPPPPLAEFLMPLPNQPGEIGGVSRSETAPQSAPDTSAMSTARPSGVDGAPARTES